MKKLNSTHRIMLYFTMASFFVGASFQSKAQSVKRQIIASYGASAVIDGISIQQTIGQSYFTSCYYDNETGLRPGFQQFSNVRSESTNSAFLNLNVYPNPAAYAVTIESTDVIKNALIQITDLSGKLMLNEKVAELTTYSINCETWANGCYFIALYDEQSNRYSSKLIIAK